MSLRDKKQLTLTDLENLEKDPRFPACRTVGKLVEVLQRLPPELPIDPFNEGVKPVIFNRKYDDIHLSFEENDGLWDDIEDDTLGFGPDEEEEEDDWNEDEDEKPGSITEQDPEVQKLINAAAEATEIFTDDELEAFVREQKGKDQ